MNLSFIHARLSITIVFFFLALAIWGFFSFFRVFIRRRRETLTGPIPGVVTSSYWGALVIGEILVILQGLLGGYLYIIGARPERGWFHILYGVVMLLCVPAAYTYTKGQDTDKEMLIYGAVMLFAFGIATRAITTGG